MYSHEIHFLEAHLVFTFFWRARFSRTRIKIKRAIFKYCNLTSFLNFWFDFLFDNINGYLDVQILRTEFFNLDWKYNQRVQNDKLTEEEDLLCPSTFVNAVYARPFQVGFSQTSYEIICNAESREYQQNQLSRSKTPSLS